MVVLKDLLQCNLAWPKQPKKIVHGRAVEEKQDQNTKEFKNKGEFTTKMS